MAEFLFPLLAAVVAGGLIGLEREWRGRAAGFRTHILVCLASALLMEASVTQGAWRFTTLPGQEIIADPARMAHGVLTGIGFLCAGVIFRTGFSIHGLTTAASLWITAAIGLVFGAGLFLMGGAATVITLLILVALRLVSRRLPEQAVADVTVRWKARGRSPESEVLAALRDLDPGCRPDQHRLDPDGLRCRTFRVRGDQDAFGELADRLAAIRGVAAFEVDPPGRLRTPP
jgi:putative Mg2+ transporter-C (MgtC) family protein